MEYDLANIKFTCSNSTLDDKFLAVELSFILPFRTSSKNCVSGGPKTSKEKHNISQCPLESSS